MSRSGYSDECDGWALIRWRGAVNSAIKGARGQAMLRELVAALDALPERRLAADSLVTAEGEYCALGALGRARGMDLTTIDPEDRRAVAKAFGVAVALAAEVMNENDEAVSHYYSLDRTMTADRAAEVRWRRIRAWAASQLLPAGQEGSAALSPTLGSTAGVA